MNQPKDPDVLEATGAVEAESSTSARASRRERFEARTEPSGDEPETGPADATGREAGDAHFEHLSDHADQIDEHHGHRSLAATSLMILIGVLVIAAGTLWAAPKFAPHLPAGIGRYLMPGEADFQARLDEVSKAAAASAQKASGEVASMRSEIAALNARLDAAEAAQSESATERETTAAALSELGVVSNAAVDEAKHVAGRLDGLAAEVEALKAEFKAMSDALAAAGTGGDGASPEVAATVAALGARVDKLSQSVQKGPDTSAIEAQLSALAGRLDSVESSAAAARDVQKTALGEVSTAIHQSNLRAAVATLSSRLASGEPYAAPLDEIAKLTGTQAPESLSAGAETGLTSVSALAASFGAYAQAAVAADVRAGAGGDTGSRVLAWLQSQVASRPISEQAGSDVGAVTSRIAARIGEGAAAEALAEAESLPTHAKDGLGPWLGQLRARVAADAALAGWLEQIGAAG